MEFPIYKACEGCVAKFTSKTEGKYIYLTSEFRHLKIGTKVDVPVDDSVLSEPTLEQYLLALPAPYGELAAKRYKERPFPKAESNLERKKNETPASVLWEAFEWDKTEEGFDFWHNVTKGQSPEIKSKKIESKEMKDFYCESSKEFAEFVNKLLVGRTKDSKIDKAIYEYTKFSVFRVGLGSIWHFADTRDFGAEKVTQGEFLDRILNLPLPKKEIKFDCKILTYTPILKNEKVEIGCQTFDLKELMEFWKAYEKWLTEAPVINTKPFYTDSSTELRAYVKAFYNNNTMGNPKDAYDLLVCNKHGEVTGDSSSKPRDEVRGEKVTNGQFIDRIQSLKAIKKGIKIPLRDSWSAEVTEGFVNVAGYSVKHEEIEKFFVELEKVKNNA